MSPTPYIAEWINSLDDLQSFGKKGGTVSSWSSLVGIITAIIGNVLISFALNIQRYAHIRIDREYNRGKDNSKSQKKLSKSIRGYGTAARQEQVAEERARINATAPGIGNENNEDDADNDDEIRPLNGSHEVNGGSRPQEKDNEESSRKSYLASPWWWLGIILMTIGEAGNFLAYGFAPASIVSPLGVVALISNCLVAPLMLKERFRQRDFWGVLVAIGGAVTVVLSAKTSETKLGPDGLWESIKRWEFLTYIGITLVLIGVLMFLSPRYGRQTILIDIGLMGMFGGYTALSTKGVASMLSGSLWRAFTFPITYALVAVLVLSAIMQIRYINRALSNFDSTQVIPTQFVMFTLSVIIGSAVLYRDFEKTDTDHVLKFIAGCLLTFSGVWLITSGRKNGDNDDDDEITHDETIQLIDEEAVTEQERTSDKPEMRVAGDGSFDQSLRQRPDLSTSEEDTSSSIPSVAVTPYGNSSGDLNSNPWISSTDHLDKTSSPRTPPRPPRLQSEPYLTPYFTPASLPEQLRRPGKLSSRSDTSPANPQTPIKQNQANSPPKPDLAVIQQNLLAETPPSNIFRSARGSIQRLMPGPLLPPLSGSLSTIVADSLLRGEGSPQSVRQSLRRHRSTGRRRSATPAFDSTEPQSAIETPSLSRWQTREDVPEDPYSAISDVGPRSEREPLDRKRSRLESFSDTIGAYLRGVRDKPSDVEQDANVNNGNNNHDGDAGGGKGKNNNSQTQ